MYIYRKSAEWFTSYGLLLIVCGSGGGSVYEEFCHKDSTDNTDIFACGGLGRGAGPNGPSDALCTRMFLCRTDSIGVLTLNPTATPFFVGKGRQVESVKRYLLSMSCQVLCNPLFVLPRHIPELGKWLTQRKLCCAKRVV